MLPKISNNATQIAGNRSSKRGFEVLAQSSELPVTSYQLPVSSSEFPLSKGRTSCEGVALRPQFTIVDQCNILTWSAGKAPK